MAKDMHKSKWDNATITKLNVFEQYVNDWLNVTLNYNQDYEAYDTLEIYDLFCGSGLMEQKQKEALLLEYWTPS